MDHDHNVNKSIKYRIDNLLWCYPDATCEAPVNKQQTQTQQHPMPTKTPITIPTITPALLLTK